MLALVDDPVERWLYPQSRQYLRHFPELLEALGHQALDEQAAWRLGEFSAVALWLPPGTEQHGEAIITVLTENVSPNQHGDTFAVVERSS